MLVVRRVTPSIKFAGTQLYTLVERCTLRVKKCLAHEHNAMFPARARTRTPRSEDERTNHEAIAPIKSFGQVADNWVKKLQSSSWPTAPGWTNHFIATSILPWIWQCAELNFPAPKPTMHLLIQFWKKGTNQFLLLFYKNKSQKLVKTYLIPAMRSFRAQIAVNSLLSMVSSLFKSNTFKSETNVKSFHIGSMN